MSDPLPPSLTRSLNTPLPLAPLSCKITSGLLASAICDALGAPCEFKARGSFPRVTKYLPNRTFNTPPGTFTDDTCMGLCLAEAIVTAPKIAESPRPDKRDPASVKDMTEDELRFIALQAYYYVQWFLHGHFSPLGYCFDIGNATRQAMGIWVKHVPEWKGKAVTPFPTADRESPPTTTTSSSPVASIPMKSISDALTEILNRLNTPAARGNGSLMRILPVPLAYWNTPDWPTTALHVAAQTSLATHPDTMCIQACQIWTWLIGTVLRETSRQNRLPPSPSTTSPTTTPTVCQCGLPPRPAPFTKLTLLHLFCTSYPLLSTLHPKLKPHLLLPTPTSPITSHPLLQSYATSPPSSGYVLDTLVAALHVFFTTGAFEEGAIKCVNLGDDADTVAAVWGGLAGVWYCTGEEWWGEEEKAGEEEDGNRREWWEGLRKREWVEQVAEALVGVGGIGRREGEEGQEKDEE